MLKPESGPQQSNEFAQPEKPKIFPGLDQTQYSDNEQKVLAVLVLGYQNGEDVSALMETINDPTIPTDLMDEAAFDEAIVSLVTKGIVKDEVDTAGVRRIYKMNTEFFSVLPDLAREL